MEHGNPFRRRQVRTSVLLALFIVLSVGVGLYLRNRESVVLTSAPVTATRADLTAALQRYQALDADDAVALRTQASGDIRQKLELAFTGSSSPDVMLDIANTLAAHQTNAVFYLSTSEASAYRDSAALLLEKEFSIGVLGDGAYEQIGTFSGEEILNDLCRAVITFRSQLGISPSSLLTSIPLSADALVAARAVDLSCAVFPAHTVNLSDISSPDAAQSFLAETERGGVLRVCIQPGDRQAARSLEYLLDALDETDMRKRAETLLLDPPQAQEALRRVYTTERAVAFTFFNLSGSRELPGVLDALKALDARALFFVTRDELADCADDVHAILEAGHDLGIAVAAREDVGPAELLEEMLLTEERIRDDFHYLRQLPCRSAYTDETEALELAAAAGGYPLLSALLTPVQQSNTRATDANKVVEEVLPAGKRTLQRGEIVHFQMGLYQHSDQLLGEVVRALGTGRNVYSVRSIVDILANETERYVYPLPDDAILPAVKDQIYPGHLSGDSMNVIAQRYIGVDWVNASNNLPGFTDDEIDMLDTKGIIKNDENLVFLTFDDWGTDATLTGILDVLAKHGAKATFFIYTQHVESNPNLLRAIAVEGHDVASHTHYHVPLSNASPDKQHLYLSLSDEQVQALEKDLVASYETMQSIIGDVEVDGKPALTRLFRPPTLAVSRIGLQTVFDCGFTWSVSGSYSTQDYMAESAKALAGEMRKNTTSGTILVMHILDSSIYTAEALDIYLTQMQSAKKPYRFVTLSKVLKDTEVE